MKTKLFKTQKGITLIALVITIIVLLILAGVSIAMLTGENGLLTKAQTSSDETKQKGAEEKVKLAVAGSLGNDGKINIEELKNNLNNIEGIDKSTIKDNLPMTIKVDGFDVNIESNGKVELNNGGSEEIGSLPSTDNTKPYLPSGDFVQVEGTDLDTGLVIKDKDENSFVWVEVPKSIYTTATSNTDYSNIEKDMQTYAAEYRIASPFGIDVGTDMWYDGCGIETEVEYNNLKNTMLKSVYNNGGFWISQYEIGTDTLRTSASDTLTPALTKEGLYPYNFITINQAQDLASKMNSGTHNSSIMFGIQWDLTMKYIEAKGAKTVDQIKRDSLQWGNVWDAVFTLTEGKYSADNGATYTDVGESYEKANGTTVILTTGATKRNSVLNIYELAGNLYEFTLEKTNVDEDPVSIRAGVYSSFGYLSPAFVRGQSGVNKCELSVGFHAVIY